jgi:hypothetical protein
MSYPSVQKIQTEQHAIDCPGGAICRCGVTPATEPHSVRMVRQQGIQVAQGRGIPAHGGVLLAMQARQR